MIKRDIIIIVAISKNYAIGKNNKLLWHLSDDLKRFKKYTTDNTIIMGKKTFLSLPNGALPNRENIVISDDVNDNFENTITVHSIKEALEKSDINKTIFIIGGGMIYNEFMKIANKLYITNIDEEFEADVFFPNVDFTQWSLIERTFFEKNEKNEYDHTFSIWYKK